VEHYITHFTGELNTQTSNNPLMENLFNVIITLLRVRLEIDLIKLQLVEFTNLRNSSIMKVNGFSAICTDLFVYLLPSFRSTCSVTIPAMSVNCVWKLFVTAILQQASEIVSTFVQRRVTYYLSRFHTQRGQLLLVFIDEGMNKPNPPTLFVTDLQNSVHTEKF